MSGISYYDTKSAIYSLSPFRYKGVDSAGVLDVTNNQSIPWLQQKLRAVSAKYNINSFYLDLGSAYNMPHYYKCVTQFSIDVDDVDNFRHKHRALY